MAILTHASSVQGALDGGLDIPHSEKRFVGYDRDGKSLDAEMLHKFIYGGHVADYMNEMQARPANCSFRPASAAICHAAAMRHVMRRSKHGHARC